MRHMKDRSIGVIALEDDESGRFHATWSRSGKRLIVTVSSRGARAQVELRPEQVEALGSFLSERPND